VASMSMSMCILDSSQVVGQDGLQEGADLRLGIILGYWWFPPRISGSVGGVVVYVVSVCFGVAVFGAYDVQMSPSKILFDNQNCGDALVQDE
jgi:hypothetical protein